MAKKKVAKLTREDGRVVPAAELSNPEMLDVFDVTPDEVLLFEGTLDLGEEDLDLDALEGAVVVTGDLVTRGDVVNLERDSGARLIVVGTAKARNLVVGGSHVIVHGALALKNTLLGLGDVGRVRVEGNLDAKAVFLGSFDVSFGARLRAPVMDYLGENVVADFGPDDDFKRLIHRDVLIDGDVDANNLMRRVRSSGKSPLTGAANPSRVIIEKAIKKFVDKGKPALKIDRTLTGHDSVIKHVRVIPEALVALSELEVLKLDYNMIKVIPESFARLVSLRELSLYGCHVEEVHESFGTLPSLERFEFSYCNGLPESFGDLDSLRWFRMFASRKMVFPPSIGRLKNLETLILSTNSFTHTDEWVERIVGMESLKRFSFDLPFFNAILPVLELLKNLEDLSLNIESFEEYGFDASHFAKLKSLHFEMRYEEVDDARAKRVVDGVLSSNTLRELTIYGWEGVDMPDDAFASMTSLEKADLSFSGLTRLPESFYALPNLKSLTSLRCKLDEPTRARIQDTFPELELDLREGL